MRGRASIALTLKSKGGCTAGAEGGDTGRGNDPSASKNERGEKGKVSWIVSANNVKGQRIFGCGSSRMRSGGRAQRRSGRRVLHGVVTEEGRSESKDRGAGARRQRKERRRVGKNASRNSREKWGLL